ncbi:MAG: RNA methyltransferase, partial [Bacteroidetes bacterium]|nr:RNA methyltransferase [Bacteroidota bacterium]
PVWGALLEGKSIYQTDLSSNGIVLIGNESHGLSPQLKEKINHPLFIPRYPLQSAGAESLNAAVATAIICAAFRKG